MFKKALTSEHLRCVGPIKLAPMEFYGPVSGGRESKLRPITEYQLVVDILEGHKLVFSLRSQWLEGMLSREQYFNVNYMLTTLIGGVHLLCVSRKLFFSKYSMAVLGIAYSNFQMTCFLKHYFFSFYLK